MSYFRKLNKKAILDNPGLFLEKIMAAIVFAAIIVATVSLWEPFCTFFSHRGEPGAFLEFMASVFSVVIGIEFFKLLCKPSKSILLEVLMFVVARHMIIEETTTTENLVSIITIGLLFLTDRYLLHDRHFLSGHSDKGALPEDEYSGKEPLPEDEYSGTEPLPEDEYSDKDSLPKDDE